MKVFMRAYAGNNQVTKDAFRARFNNNSESLDAAMEYVGCTTDEKKEIIEQLNSEWGSEHFQLIEYK